MITQDNKSYSSAASVWYTDNNNFWTKSSGNEWSSRR